MEMKRAGDIMIPLDEYPHIPYWFTLRQTIAELESSVLQIRGRTSLPRVVLVFDEKYQLMGAVRRRDILRGLEPQFLTEKNINVRKRMFDIKVDPNLSEFSYDKLLEEIRKQAERQVSEVMQPIVTTVEHDDHMVKVMYEMVDHNLSFVPVMKDNKVAGVVRSVDLVHEVAQFLL